MGVSVDTAPTVGWELNSYVTVRRECLILTLPCSAVEERLSVLSVVEVRVLPLWIQLPNILYHVASIRNVEPLTTVS